jgi:DNA-binding NarL/FixJ family response regulator
MAQTTEALTDTDLAILGAYADRTPFADIATRNRMTKDDLGYRLKELCGLDRDAARRLLESLPNTTPATVPVDLTTDDSEPAAPATRYLTDREQEVMRSYGGGNTVAVIARAKRMEPADVNKILDLVDRKVTAAATAGRTGAVTVAPAILRPAPKPRPAEAAPLAATARPKPNPAAKPDPDPHPVLTPRQTEILPLLAGDLDFEDIAGRLGVTVSTAYGLASATYRALGTGARASAVAAAIRLGLLPAPQPQHPEPATAQTVDPDPGRLTPDVDLTAILADTARDTDITAPPPAAPVPGPSPAATPNPEPTPADPPRPAAGPTVQITIIRAGRTWTTTVELDPDDTDTTVNVRVRPPGGQR